MTTIKIVKIMLVAAFVCMHAEVLPASTPLSLWNTLKKSNKKFVKNHKMSKKRAKLRDAQNPPCIILGCSDSRVPPETIFDQKPGQFFVVRVAGEVVDDVVVDSIEYAVGHFDVGLIIILGHSDCGAVSGALKHLKANKGVPEIPHDHLGAVLIPIERAIVEAGIDIYGPHALQQATQANVRYIANQLMSSSTTIKNGIKKGQLAIVGAEYNLESGKVDQFFTVQ